ncbi:MAG: DUF4097 family beta strand repeat-containing protein [Clostridia bacterium]|nr:DUF4097 family beta strand repeat-containing protein [Clostridia bacterium]
MNRTARNIIVALLIGAFLVAAAYVVFIIYVFITPVSDTLKNESYSFDADNVFTVSIDAPVGYVTISGAGEGDKISVVVFEDGDVIEYMAEVSAEGGLTIAQAALTWYNEIRYSGSTLYGITVTLPISVECNVIVRGGTGDVTLTSLSIGGLSVDATSGAVLLDDVTPTEGCQISVSTTSGSISCSFSDGVSPEDYTFDVETQYGSTVLPQKLTYSVESSATEDSVAADYTLRSKNGGIEVTFAASEGE